MLADVPTVQSHREHTEKDMFEHAVRLDLVQRRLEQALLIHAVVIIVSERTELLSL